MPLYGHDLDPSDRSGGGQCQLCGSPNAAAQKAGFSGSERILKALDRGPARKLVGFTVEGKMPVREGAPIFAGDTQVGVVTSGGFAPSVGAPIAMGYVAAAASCRSEHRWRLKCAASAWR